MSLKEFGGGHPAAWQPALEHGCHLHCATCLLARKAPSPVIHITDIVPKMDVAGFMYNVSQHVFMDGEVENQAKRKAYFTERKTEAQSPCLP